MNRPLGFTATSASLLLCFALQPCLFAQRGGQQPSGAQRGGMPSMDQTSLTLMVNVREATGAPLDAGAIVKLDSYAGSIHIMSSTRDAGVAQFNNIPPDDYNIEASAAGYQTATERVTVIGGGSTFPVYIYLEAESAPKTPNVPGSPTIMSPRLQSEMDKALDKLRHEQYDAARAHLQKAEKMAPGNPDVPYLFGLLEYKEQHLDAARGKFEKAISLYPNHIKSYLMLGEVLLRTGHAAEAAQTLEKAYQANGADSRVHLLLAQAYVAQKQYDKAEPHAARAVELEKNKGAAAEFILGEILAREGKPEEAIRSLQALLKNFPTDASAEPARALLTELQQTELQQAELQKPVVVPVAEKTIPPVLSPTKETKEKEAVPALVATWAPPDIDAKEYPLAPGVACQEDQVLHRAELRSNRQLANFERFAATEHIVHQEVQEDGKAGIPKERDFKYLVFIQRTTNGHFYLDEERDGGQNLSEFPTKLASTGLVSLGVAVFQKDFQDGLNYKCEGLGKWRGEPSWQIRFEQRKDATSRLRAWRNSHGSYSIPLKGRVWVSANTYDVLHLETDLREPQPLIDLTRDHLIVDYGPVQFRNGKTSVWLPWYAEMFMELHGKRYHHRHTLTNYELFSVDTTDTVSVPQPTGGN